MVASLALVDVTPRGSEVSIPQGGVFASIRAAMAMAGREAPDSNRFDAADTGTVGDVGTIDAYARRMDEDAIEHLRGLRRNRNRWSPPRWLRRMAEREARRQGLRADALTPGFGAFPRDFEFVRRRIFEERKPVLTGFSIFPQDTEVPLGVRKHTVRRMTGAGEAQIFRGGSEFPRARNAYVEESFGVAYVVCAVETSFFDLLTTDRAGVRQYDNDMRLARRLVEERMNRIAWFGDPASQIPGVVSYPHLAKAYFPVAINRSANPETIASALADFAGIPMVRSNGTFMPTRLAVAPGILQQLATRKHASGTDTTILRYFMAGQAEMGGIQRVFAAPELKGIGPNGEDGMLFYRPDIESLAHVLIQAPTALPIWRSSPIDTITVVFGATGGVIMPEVGDALLVLVPKQ
jgi:hypothetical protein